MSLNGGWAVLAILIVGLCLVGIVKAIAGRNLKASLAEARFHIAHLIDGYDRPPNTVQERLAAAEQFLKQNGGDS